MHFINGRLEKILLYPDDPAALQADLEAHGSPLANAREDSPRPGVHAWRHEDYRNQHYIGWEDTRLKLEVRDWVKWCT